MARTVRVHLLDDLDGSTADETVTFGLDGVGYEIDLSSAHADEMRAALSGFVGSGRRLGRSGGSGRSGIAGAGGARIGAAPGGGRVGGAGRAGAGGAGRAGSAGRAGTVAPAHTDRERNLAIRAWAKRKKIQLSDRGRIPRTVVEQFDAQAGR